MNHDPIEELLGAYALHAVDDAEAASVEAHLAVCPRCRAELDTHLEVAANLAMGGAPAPSGVWERIAATIESRDAPPPPLRLVVAGSEAARGDVVRLRPRQRRGVVLGAAAAVLAIVALSITAIGERNADRSSGVADAAIAALSSPDARIATLTTPDGEALAQVAELDGEGYLIAGALPDLDDTIYQLWGFSGDNVVSLGPLGSSPSVVSFPVDESITDFMITEEDEPVERSTNIPVVRGALA